MIDKVGIPLSSLISMETGWFGHKVSWEVLMDTPSLNGLVGSLLEPEWEGVSLLINVAYRIEPGLFVFESSIDEYPDEEG